MDAETRRCMNCQAEFLLESDDFTFFEKMKIQPPTWCASCQLQKRLAFRNERSLHRRKCQVPGHTEEVISIYHPDAEAVVYDQKSWWGDTWDGTDYAKDYDFNRPFFEQLADLIKTVPWPALYNLNGVDSDYCNMTTDNKNCYLVFGGDFNENCSYSTFNFHSRDSMDLYFVDKCELSYGVVDSEGCYNVLFGRYLKDCSDSAFLYNCISCQHCFGCVNLRSASYCIFNEQYTKEEYEKKLKEFDIGNHQNLVRIKERFTEFKRKLPHRYVEILKSVGSTGDNIFNAKDCRECFDITGPAEDMKHVVLAGWGAKDVRNASHYGHQSELGFDCFGVFSGSQRVAYSYVIGTCHDILYSYNCKSANNLFGCVGVRNKSYCILNKQYSKEEYESLVPKIVAHMDAMPYKDKKGRTYKSGESLPANLSPFAYNETIAYEYFPLTEAEARAEGYIWRTLDKKAYTPTLRAGDLPNHINEVQDGILMEVIGCEHEGNCLENCMVAFKITPQELQFYRRANLPLPRLCSSCRHYGRLSERNPRKLWKRTCHCAGKQAENSTYTNTVEHLHGTGHCSNEFQTTFSDERPEIVYCEQCYQAEFV